MSDLIERQVVLDTLNTYWKNEVDKIPKETGFEKLASMCDTILKYSNAIAKLIKHLSSAQPEPQWIPIKTRPMTDEERDYWSDHFGYDVGYENDTMFDCKMPEDQQPVWVQSNCGYVYEDVCENNDGMLGLEGNGDWSDIVAWMPKYVPEPWRGEEP